MNTIKELFKHGLPEFTVYEVKDLAKGEVIGYFSTESLAEKFVVLSEARLPVISEIKINGKEYFEKYLGE